MTAEKPKQPLEIQYRFRGVAPKRKTFKSQAAFEKWLEKQDSDIQIIWASTPSAE